MRFIRSLRSNPHIVIKPSDKNLGLALMDAYWYRQQCNLHLSDRKTYTPLNSKQATALCITAFNRIKSTATTALQQKPPLLTKQQRDFLLHRTANDATTRFPLFYCIPKLHKTPVATRPIVASHSFVTTNASRWLDIQLQPFVARIPTVLRDSRSLVRTFEQSTRPYPLPATGTVRWFVTADVTALYPSIPIDDGIAAVREHLTSANAEIGFTNLVIDLLAVVLQFNVIESTHTALDAAPFDHSMPSTTAPPAAPTPSTFWKQTTGTAMGTPCAVVFANIYMYERYDKPLLANSVYPISMYRRYIDDVFCFIDLPATTTASPIIDALLNRPSTPNLRLTVTASTEHADFLDLTLSAGPLWLYDSRPIVQVFQKRFNRYLYLPSGSFHTPAQKRSLITAELRRYVQFSSFESDFQTIRTAFLRRLRDRGFAFSFLLPLFRSILYSDRHRFLGLVTSLHQPEAKHPSKRTAGSVLRFKTNHTPLLDQLPLRAIFRRHLDTDGSVPLADFEPALTLYRAPNFRDLLCASRRPSVVTSLQSSLAPVISAPPRPLTGYPPNL
jgi:hypothetical protein